jgi:hypothetical protein
MKAFVVALATLVLSSAAQADDIVSMISQYRRAHGLPAVQADATLSSLAKQQANAMASHNVLSHEIGGSFKSRIQHANLGQAGENVAMGQRSWADALRAWKSSPGHNRNLLMPGATRVGVAVSYSGGAKPRAYWAMMIGGGSETRTVRVIGPNGKVVGTRVHGFPFMMSMQSRTRVRATGAREMMSSKGEITGNE